MTPQLEPNGRLPTFPPVYPLAYVVSCRLLSLVDSRADPPPTAHFQELDGPTIRLLVYGVSLEQRKKVMTSANSPSTSIPISRQNIDQTAN
jgi:hypothetical protein